MAVAQIQTAREKWTIYKGFQLCGIEAFRRKFAQCFNVKLNQKT